MQAESPFRSAKCHSCGKTGHINRTCCSKKTGGGRGNALLEQGPPQPAKRSVKRVQRDNPPEQDNQPDPHDSPPEYTLYQVLAKSPVKPLEVDVEINSQKLSMEVDMGAAVSLVSETTCQKWWPSIPLELPSARLQENR